MSRGVVVALALLVGCSDEPERVDVARCFDSQPRPLEVVVDPDLAAPAAFTWECEGNAGWGDGACSSDPSVGARLEDDLNLYLKRVGFVGWWPLVEVSEQDGARLCSVRFSDVDDDDDLRCREPVCARRGSVTLSAFPTAPGDQPIAVVVDVEFDGGARMRAEFAIQRVQ